MLLQWQQLRNGLCSSMSTRVSFKTHVYLKSWQINQRVRTAGFWGWRSSSSSSSFYWAWVANAPNVLQPYWLIVLPLDVPDLTASPLLWGPSDQRWRCLWTFLFSSVPTFATSLLQEILAAKGGSTWARNGRWILPEIARLPRNIQESFTCRKCTT